MTPPTSFELSSRTSTTRSTEVSVLQCIHPQKSANSLFVIPNLFLHTGIRELEFDQTSYYWRACCDCLLRLEAFLEAINPGTLTLPPVSASTACL